MGPARDRWLGAFWFQIKTPQPLKLTFLYMKSVKDIIKEKAVGFAFNLVSLIVMVIILFLVIYAFAAFLEPSSAPDASNQDFNQNILGANNGDNLFNSSSVSANNDGSIIERLEYLWTQLNTRALDSEVGNAGDAANMGTTLFAGQQYLWDNRASFGNSSGLTWRGYAGPSTGNLGYIKGANALCNSAYSGSHWASLDEIIRLGSNYPWTYNVWVRDAFSSINTDSYFMKDGNYATSWQMGTVGGGTCRGWISSSGDGCSFGSCDGSYLSTWGYSGITVCSENNYIACVSG